MRIRNKKRAYYNAETQGLQYFSRKEALQLGPEWQMVPDMENFINEDGKHQIRLHFPDFTVDLTETDESIAANEKGKSMISGVEVAGNGNGSAK